MTAKKDWSPDRGDIIWIDFNPQTGREMRDMHTILVLSPMRFNDRTGIVIGLPMTTAEYNKTNPFVVQYMGKRELSSYILTLQPKSFDWRQRGAKAHPWEKAPPEVLAEACELLNQIITLTD